MSSDNARGADYQQERPIASVIGILRDHTLDIRVFRMKRWSDLHGDMQGRESVGASRQQMPERNSLSGK
jgi:hypothetical protein